MCASKHGHYQSRFFVYAILPASREVSDTTVPQSCFVLTVVHGVVHYLQVSVPGVENVNLSKLVGGHEQYMAALDDILDAINLHDN